MNLSELKCGLCCPLLVKLLDALRLFAADQCCCFFYPASEFLLYAGHILQMSYKAFLTYIHLIRSLAFP